MGDWHNIATQDDIESLLSAYGDFHDACIVEAHFKRRVSEILCLWKPMLP